MTAIWIFGPFVESGAIATLAARMVEPDRPNHAE